MGMYFTDIGDGVLVFSADGVPIAQNAHTLVPVPLEEAIRMAKLQLRMHEQEAEDIRRWLEVAKGDKS